MMTVADIMFRIMLVLLIVLSSALGGAVIAARQIAAEAIDNGVAEWYIDGNGEKGFRWIKPDKVEPDIKEEEE